MTNLKDGTFGLFAVARRALSLLSSTSLELLLQQLSLQTAWVVWESD